MVNPKKKKGRKAVARVDFEMLVNVEDVGGCCCESSGSQNTDD